MLIAVINHFVERSCLGWVELDETRNAAVYVSNLPKTITEDAFIVSLFISFGAPSSNTLLQPLYLLQNWSAIIFAFCYKDILTLD